MLLGKADEKLRKACTRENIQVFAFFINKKTRTENIIQATRTYNPHFHISRATDAMDPMNMNYRKWVSKSMAKRNSRLALKGCNANLRLTIVNIEMHESAARRKSKRAFLHRPLFSGFCLLLCCCKKN